ncbi:MAG: hypothetical protein AMXMBFR4_24200 [Candidatus Hydrogenedentota bacterium]
MNSILAIIPNWIGDVAMCTPALRALSRRFPNAALTVAGRAAACELLDGLRWVHRCVVIPHRPGPIAMLTEAWRLRAHARDLAVVFPHSHRSALLARMTGARRRLGYDRDGRGYLLTDRVGPHLVKGRIEPVYMAQEYLELVAALGCEDDGAGLELHADEGALAQVRPALAGEGPLVGIAPGAAFGPSKLWPADRYAAVADGLTDRIGARCVLLTGPGEEAIRDAVASVARRPLIRADADQPTIAKLKAVVSLLDLLVCNDSGTRHIAVAFKVPTVCIMGPTSPKFSAGPYERGEVLRVDVDCGPCQKPVCATDHRCMTRITTEWVLNSAVNLLSGRTR